VLLVVFVNVCFLKEVLEIYLVSITKPKPSGPQNDTKNETGFNRRYKAVAVNHVKSAL